MGLMFAARRVLGVQTRSLFPEIYESDGENEDENEPVDEETSEASWTRYAGDDPTLLMVNEMADTWDAWEPYSPAEKALKNAVDKVREKYC